MRYLLVDANHLASRCRHVKGSKELRTSDGRRSGVLHGVLRSMSWMKNTTNIQPQSIICYWDGGRSTRRMDLWEGYKSGRNKENPTDEEILERREYYQQIDACIQSLSYLGIRQVRVDGVEADDLISIYATVLSDISPQNQVVVHSGDHDLHQLASDQISIFHPEKGILSTSDILERWLLTDVCHIPACKALSGDTSDAIPGVPKMGKKRAALVAPYLHFVLSTGEVSGVPESTLKWIELARSHSEIVVRNLKLMTLPRNFSESYYSPDQARRVIDQMTGNGMRKSMASFIDFCRKWELVSVLESLHYW